MDEQRWPVGARPLAQRWHLQSEAVILLSPLSSSGGGLFGRPVIRKDLGRFLILGLFFERPPASHLYRSRKQLLHVRQDQIDHDREIDDNPGDVPGGWEVREFQQTPEQP